MAAFPRAKRFVEKVEQLPEAGDYDPKEPDSWKFKRGAFLETSTRFNKQTTEDIPFHEGPNYQSSVISTAKKPATSAVSIAMTKKLKKDLDDMIVRYDALKESSTKEAESLQNRVTKTEQATALLQKEKSAVQAELNSYRVKLAEVTAREESTRQAFEKAKKAYDAASEKSQKSTALQRKVEELERVHLQAKKSRCEEIDRLQTKLRGEQEAQQELRQSLQEAINKLEKCRTESEKDKNNMTKAVDEAQRQYNHVNEEAKRQYEQYEKQLQAFKAATEQERQKNLNQLTELKSLLQNKDEIAQSLRRDAVLKQEQSEKSVYELKAELEQERYEHESTLQELTLARGTLRQRLMETNEVHARLLGLEDNWKTLTEAYSKMLKSVKSSEAHRECTERLHDLESQLEDAEDRFIDHMRAKVVADGEVLQLQEQVSLLEERLRHEQQKPEKCLEADESLESLEQLQRTLDHVAPQVDVNLNTEALLHEYDALLVRDAYTALCTEYEQKCNQAEETREDLEQIERDHLKTQRELATAQMTIDTLEQEVNLLDKQVAELSNAPIQELEEQIARLEAALQERGESQKADAATIRKLQVSNAQEKVIQDKLLLRIQELETTLDTAEQYQESYEQLQEQVDVLVKEYGLAEEEQRRLGLFNAALLGNANPKQRIKHVANLREQNAKLKKDALTAAHERDKARLELQAVQRELESYKAITTAQPTRISRVQRHVLNSRDDNIHTINVGELMKGIQRREGVENEW